MCYVTLILFTFFYTPHVALHTSDAINVTVLPVPVATEVPASPIPVSTDAPSDETVAHAAEPRDAEAIYTDEPSVTVAV